MDRLSSIIADALEALITGAGIRPLGPDASLERVAQLEETVIDLNRQVIRMRRYSFGGDSVDALVVAPRNEVAHGDDAAGHEVVVDRVCVVGGEGGRVKHGAAIGGPAANAPLSPTHGRWASSARTNASRAERKRLPVAASTGMPRRSSSVNAARVAEDTRPSFAHNVPSRSVTTISMVCVDIQ